MIDIKKLREDPEFFRRATEAKNRDAQIVDEVLVLDEKKREHLQKVEILRAERNKLGKEGIERGKQIKIDLNRLEADLSIIDEDLKCALWKLPNPALPEVPIGKDENGNIEIKKVGDVPKFDFPVKAHYELGESLDLIDTERASKVSGTRFRYIKNEGALIEMALVNLGLKTLVQKGFTPILPSEMIKKDVMAALGYDNYGFDNTYCLDEEGTCLIPTAEHAIAPYFMNEVLGEEDLPKRFVGYSGAFRKESGSYGKDTKGMFRVHFFTKLEMVSFVKPEDSEKEHQFLVSIEEELMQKLKLPYHVIRTCTGDLGDPAAAKFDIEAWFPSENKFS
ncbi:MAG: serine--tRNA ligase [Patescibacteria group bacterium]|nr:serine--tRNA ligase [Patescibacteria group bacterium]